MTKSPLQTDKFNFVIVHNDAELEQAKAELHSNVKIFCLECKEQKLVPIQDAHEYLNECNPRYCITCEEKVSEVLYGNKFKISNDRFKQQP